MPDGGRPSIVLDHLVAAAAGLVDDDRVYAVAAPGRRAARVDPEAIIDVLHAAGPGALVLALPPWVHPPVAPLAAVAAVLGRDLLWLPADLPAAVWAAGLICAWARTTPPDSLRRRAQVAVGLAGMAPAHLPMRPWGPDGVEVPAMGTGALARWCDCAWRPCRWCHDDGALGAPCPACGDMGARA